MSRDAVLRITPLHYDSNSWGLKWHRKKYQPGFTSSTMIVSEKVEVIMQHGTHNAQGIMFLCSELDNKRGWIKVHILSAVFMCVVCYSATYKEVDRTTVATNWNRGNVCKPNFIFHILMVSLSKISPMTPVSILLLWNWQWMSPFFYYHRIKVTTCLRRHIYSQQKQIFAWWKQAWTHASCAWMYLGLLH